MKNTTEIDINPFSTLLNWLDPNRDAAAVKYEAIRLRLIRIFQYRGSNAAEELADETFERVTRKVPDLIDSYEGDPALYFFGVANNVFRESLKKPRFEELPMHSAQEEAEEEDPEAEFDCLDECLKSLPGAERKFIIGYYQEDKKAKIDNRKKLAEATGIGLANARVKAFRIRVKLQDCVTACLAL